MRVPLTKSKKQEKKKATTRDISLFMEDSDDLESYDRYEPEDILAAAGLEVLSFFAFSMLISAVSQVQLEHSTVCIQELMNNYERT